MKLSRSPHPKHSEAVSPKVVLLFKEKDFECDGTALFVFRRGAGGEVFSSSQRIKIL
jgi:hypothetical protein